MIRDYTWLAATFLAAAVVLVLYLIWTTTEFIGPGFDHRDTPNTVSITRTVTATQ